MMLKHLLPTILIVLLSACGSSPNLCGGGTKVEHEDRSYCVYDTVAITEEGFRCPDGFQFEFEFREFTACGASGNPPPTSFEQFVREQLGLIPPRADAGTDASAVEDGGVLTVSLPILDIPDTSEATGSTGCIAYVDGVFRARTTTFEPDNARPPTDQSCVFVFFEGLGDYDEIYPDFYLISSDAWTLGVEGLTRNRRPYSQRDPNDHLYTSSDNFVVPGLYPFILYAEDPETDQRTGEELESGTLETLSYDARTREMVVRVEVNP